MLHKYQNETELFCMLFEEFGTFSLSAGLTHIGDSLQKAIIMAPLDILGLRQVWGTMCPILDLVVIY